MDLETQLPPCPFSSRAKLIVGVSGGSDSLALLRSLQEQLPRAAQRLVAAHVNYGLRGRDSDKDERIVQRFCRDAGIPLRCLRVENFKRKVVREKRSLQDLAREIRYVFFRKLVRREKAWGVAVAHHQEDQAETVLDRLLRGAGTRGLSGLKPVQVLSVGMPPGPLKIWRPLLSFPKSWTQTYLRARGIRWREDKSNGTNQYRRNQIRNQVLPFLARWNPNLPETLARIGEIVAAEDQVMGRLLSPLGKRLDSRWSRGGHSCDGAELKKIPLALKRRWARQAAEKLTDKARGLSFDRIEEIIRLWEGRERGPRDMGFGLTAGFAKGRAFLRWKA
jgi:tRNA(Ile)-lysidine synthase